MKAVVMRVTKARVTVGDEVVGEIKEPGLLVLLGITTPTAPNRPTPWPASCTSCGYSTTSNPVPAQGLRCSW